MYQEVLDSFDDVERVSLLFNSRALHFGDSSPELNALATDLLLIILGSFLCDLRYLLQIVDHMLVFLPSDLDQTLHSVLSNI